jgi:SAM-dependent methyltransferase
MSNAFIKINKLLLTVLYNQKQKTRLIGIRSKAKQILNKIGKPNTTISEADFHLLCSTYSGPGEYGYDKKSTWLRGLRRADQLVSLIPQLASEHRCLEVACGDGMASLQLNILGMETTLTDLNDWRDIRAAYLPFYPCDLGADASLPGEDFDLVFSYNAFEHFPNPEIALQRMLAVTAPGGYLFFEFGPLYAGPWGLHAYRMLPMPYPQFLFREQFWRDQINRIGIRDLGKDLNDLQPLNRWTVTQFDQLWSNSGCEVLINRHHNNAEYLDIILQYPEAFQGRGLTYDDLTTQGVTILLRKPSL